MNWEGFKHQFHESWHHKIKPFIESEECDKIYEHLKKRSKKGHLIAPSSSNTFRCFLETPLDEMKVVLMGMAPYHTMIKTMNGNITVADGLLMGCSNTSRLQPSLEKFYEALEKELWEGKSSAQSADVSYLAKQGVLMFNASLTTEINKAGSHLELWHPFTKFIIENVINYTGIPVVFLGADAAVFKKYIAPFQWSFTLKHPASAAYRETDWNTEGVFTKVNKILKDNNNFEIQWLQEL
jgi:uracil-DNA glycosylase